jgi:protein-S-isoprenylcysteine O-methyltransferase Ste14
MWVLIRAVTYSSLFIGLLLVFLPARVLEWSGISSIPTMGAWQVGGMFVVGAGSAIALSCILAFATLGKDTPLPLDPPRHLVVRGPYRLVRNPMYVGAALVLAGAAMYHQSIGLLCHTGLFVLAMHGFVVIYEEPTLRQSFGSDYDAYCGQVGRWLPKL